MRVKIIMIIIIKVIIIIRIEIINFLCTCRIWVRVPLM